MFVEILFIVALVLWIASAISSGLYLVGMESHPGETGWGGWVTAVIFVIAAPVSILPLLVYLHPEDYWTFVKRGVKRLLGTL